MIIFWMPYLSVIQLFCSAWYYFWVNPCIDIDINHTGLKCQYRHLPTYMWPAPKTLTCSKTSTSSRIFMAYIDLKYHTGHFFSLLHRLKQKLLSSFLFVVIFISHLKIIVILYKNWDFSEIKRTISLYSLASTFISILTN